MILNAQGTAEVVNTVTAAGAAQTLPAPYQASTNRLTLTAASCALTFPAPLAGESLTLVLVQDGTGGRAVTWDAAVKWPGGTAPTLTATAGAVDVFAFTCTDGATWSGFTSGLNVR